MNTMLTTARPRIALSVATLAAALLATTAYTSGSPESTNFVCEDGDRFVVEFLTGHVRLRHGTGIFALAEVKPGRVYSDGRILLHAGTTQAMLEQPDIGLRQHCVAIVAPA